MRRRSGIFSGPDGLAALIVLAAMAIRLGYLWYYRSLPDWNLLTVDNYYHHHWAQSIAGGNLLGDTTYFRAPFYVYCLAALYAVFGDSLWVARLFGAAIGSATVFCVYLIGKKALSSRIGLIAAALLAVYPVCVYFDGELLLDSLFALLLLMTFHQFLLWRERRTSRAACFTGILLGLSAITRPTALVFAVVAIVWLFFSLPRTMIWRQSLAFLVGLACLIAPIFVRNMAVAGDPVLIASQGGINLYIGNNESADGISAVMPEPLGHNWRMRDITYVAEKAAGHLLRPGEISSYWSGRALEWCWSHPVDALRLYLRKLYFSVSNRDISNNRNMATFFSTVPFLRLNPLNFALLFALGLAGVMIGFRNSFAIRMWTIVVVCLIVANSLFFVNSRFRLPAVPFLILLVAFAVASLPQYARERRSAAIRALIVAVVAFLVSYLPVCSLPKGAGTQTLLSRATYAFSEKDYAAALRFARQAEALDPTFPETNLNIGACYFKMGLTDSARHHFLLESEFHPERPKAYTDLGSLELVNQRYAEARQLASKALSLRPYDENANLLYLRACALDTALPLDSLRLAVQQALQSAGDNLAVLNEAAAALAQRGGQIEAESILSRAILLTPPPIETDDGAFEKDFPNRPDHFARRKAATYSLLAYVSGLNGDFPRSISNARTAIALDPDAADAYVNLASGYLSSGDFLHADSILSVATERFPSNQRLNILKQRMHQ